MIKLKTILPKNPNDLGLVIPGNLIPDIKFFRLKIKGTACMIQNGIPYCIYNVKSGKSIPNGAIPCQEDNLLSGHHPHWIPLDKNNPSHKYMLEGFNNLSFKEDGTYECIGPKIQGNPHQETSHLFIPHFYDNLNYNIDFKEMNQNPYDYFFNLFKDFSFEGLIAYNDNLEPIGKIRRKDFGFKNVKFDKVSPILNTIIPTIKLQKIINDFLDIAVEYHNFETESAPSGEWESYNYMYLALEAEYNAYKKIIFDLGYSLEEVFDKDERFSHFSYYYKG